MSPLPGGHGAAAIDQPAQGPSGAHHPGLSLQLLWRDGAGHLGRDQAQVRAPGVLPIVLARQGQRPSGAPPLPFPHPSLAWLDGHPPDPLEL